MKAHFSGRNARSATIVAALVGASCLVAAPAHAEAVDLWVAENAMGTECTEDVECGTLQAAIARIAAVPYGAGDSVTIHVRAGNYDGVRIQGGPAIDGLTVVGAGVGATTVRTTVDTTTTSPEGIVGNARAAFAIGDVDYPITITDLRITNNGLPTPIGVPGIVGDEDGARGTDEVGIPAGRGEGLGLHDGPLIVEDVQIDTLTGGAGGAGFNGAGDQDGFGGEAGDAAAIYHVGETTNVTTTVRRVVIHTLQGGPGGAAGDPTAANDRAGGQGGDAGAITQGADPVGMAPGPSGAVIVENTTISALQGGTGGNNAQFPQPLSTGGVDGGAGGGAVGIAATFTTSTTVTDSTFTSVAGGNGGANSGAGGIAVGILDGFGTTTSVERVAVIGLTGGTGRPGADGNGTAPNQSVGGPGGAAVGLLALTEDLLVRASTFAGATGGAGGRGGDGGVTVSTLGHPRTPGRDAARATVSATGLPGAPGGDAGGAAGVITGLDLGAGLQGTPQVTIADTTVSGIQSNQAGDGGNGGPGTDTGPQGDGGPGGDVGGGPLFSGFGAAGIFLAPSATPAEDQHTLRHVTVVDVGGGTPGDRGTGPGTAEDGELEPSGGIVLAPGADTGTLAASLLANNEHGNCNAGLLGGLDGDANTYDIASPACGGGTVVEGLAVAPLANNGGPTPTRALAANSPAASLVLAATGFCAGDSAVDQRGLPRPGVGAPNCAAGAFEPQAEVDEPGGDSGSGIFGSGTGNQDASRESDFCGAITDRPRC